MSRSDFRPVPTHLRRMRDNVTYHEWSRFYGTFESFDGKIKRFNFSVRVNPRLSNMLKHRKIVEVVNALKNNNIPVHKQRQIFSSFNELMERTEWIEVKELRDYKAGMRYER